MEFDKNSAEENTHQLQVLQANREAYLQQFLVTASQDLATGKTNLDQAQAQLTGALKHRELVRFVAPEDAQVMSIAGLSVGSVLDAGRALMTLTPVSVPLEVEVKLRPATIGYIRVGDPVTLKIDAFEFTEHGTLQGVVRWISEDIVDPNRPDPTTTTGVQPAGVVLSSSGAGSQTLAYYKARIEIQKSDLRAMPAVFHFSPGMTLSADIKVGTRSVGGYLFGYVSGNLSEVLRDP
jgi:hemolysin D